MDEIYRAVNTIAKAGNNNICILHCVSIYPTETSKIRLNNILGLRKEFPDYPIGFSDHSLGIEMPIAAAALGACMFEKLSGESCHKPSFLPYDSLALRRSDLKGPKTCKPYSRKARNSAYD